MIDVNTQMVHIADSILKTELLRELQQLYKDFGQAANADEAVYISNRLYQEINRRYRSMHWGVIIKAFENALLGKTSMSKITVHSILVSLQKQADAWSEVQVRNNHAMIESREKELKNKAIASANSPIANAAVWLISKRCDKVDVGDIQVRQVAECFERGINPETLLKKNV
jgi:hypothetical protein